MSDETKKRRPWLTAIVVLTLVVVAGQAAYLFYVQQRVMTALNGVYGELSASPELNALLDLNATLPSGDDIGKADSPSPSKADVNESLKNLQEMLGPNSSGSVQQLLDMTKQLAQSYGAASSDMQRTPQPQTKPDIAVQLPDITLAETGDTYRLEMDFGSAPIDHLTAEADDQTVHITGAASNRHRRTEAGRPFTWAVSLNSPIEPDSLTLASEGNSYTVVVKKKTTAA